MCERIQGQICRPYVMACFAIAPGLVVPNDLIEDLASPSTRWRWMLNTVALALVVAEVLRGSTET